MVRRRAYAFMDTDSLLRLVYAIATARYRNEQTPKRRIVEARVIEILVTSYILNETNRNLEKIIRNAKIKRHGWDLPVSEVVIRVRNELEAMIESGVITNIEDPNNSGYARALQAVLKRPKRKVLLAYSDELTTCVRQEARSTEIEKDIPVVEGILLAYDVAAAIPLGSRASIVEPPFLAVTYDDKLFRSLSRCLQRLHLDDKIILIKYPVFGKLLGEWDKELSGEY